MKINLRMIQSDLAELCIHAQITSSCLKREIQYVSIYQKGKQTRQDTVYILRSTDIFDRKELDLTAPYCIIGKLICALPSECNYILIKEMDNIDLLERIQMIFRKYEDWEHDLQKAVLRDRDLKYIGMLATRMFHNPLQFYNQKTLNCVFSVYENEKYAWIQRSAQKF